MFKAQVLSTPKFSPWPWGHPREIEERDGHILTDWIAGLNKNSNVDIMMRNFVDWDRYQPTMAKVIGLNLAKRHVIPSTADRFARLINVKDDLDKDPSITPAFFLGKQL